MIEPDWSRALCRRNPPLWDDTADAANTSVETPAQRSIRHRAAITFCRLCSVIDTCRSEVAVAANPTGVWAGEVYPRLGHQTRSEIQSKTDHRAHASTAALQIGRPAGIGGDSVDGAFTALMTTIQAQREARETSDTC
ncbi:WhiB family transcriptional regulator [Rhodococcus opacus]|uniref:WhiB family transcriptional regulator n=1 Tax=Rhodococcus opacus TaxID=37919 RepID=A0AAX3Y9B4_RHOOP|nr:WhiB family transcriptional regulator [Rhodococcus opacus]MCZ4586339.1 WhiB family transcriptional regulator [Rhodococcus opacus]WLF44790.1 WhiB family transcriptional regulator [Rhodococcus opacus]